ncbi:MAG: hypothetical protein WCD62_24440 [Pseudolabrys sp.]
MPFLPTAPESDFRLAPGSFNSKLENLILNHIPTIADMRAALDFLAPAIAQAQQLVRKHQVVYGGIVRFHLGAQHEAVL